VARYEKKKREEKQGAKRKTRTLNYVISQHAAVALSTTIGAPLGGIAHQINKIASSPHAGPLIKNEEREREERKRKRACVGGIPTPYITVRESDP
jgi:hypothetical protein